MLKHAFLILAHNEFYVLEKLISCLDDKRNDIYIHFDRKLSHLPDLQTHNATLFILDERVNVHWGDVSVISAEYRLFEEASANRKYTFYHLLSGVDLPLKSQDRLHSFFNYNQGREFIGFSSKNAENEIDRKVRRIHLYSKRFRSKKGVISFWYRGLRAVVLRFQLLLGLRQNLGQEFKKGGQWVSVTDDFVQYILPKKEEVLKTYKRTFCSDEIFLQTLCWNSHFRFRLFNILEEFKGCQRIIGWKDGQLIEWDDHDFNTLITSEVMFGRKFSFKNRFLVDKIVWYVKRNE